MAIQHTNLRDQVREELLNWLADGRLPPGQRLEEERISRALGVSRTPLREAMLTLAAAGFLDSDMGKGFGVPALVVDTFVEIQTLLTRLAPLAISLTGALQQPPTGRKDLVRRPFQIGRASCRERV